VPASECTLSPCDRIFTRIGANDRIIAGQSTFLVELSETSTILEYATSRSLVVLDELGRGTSTHDGYAIAHSVLHDLVQRVSPLLMFSTHYHNLTDELRGNAQVGLFHMSCMVDDAAKAVTFLHKLTRGSTSESYGLHCAQVREKMRVVACAEWIDHGYCRRLLALEDQTSLEALTQGTR
jgi:DNA mismatch repair protein MSH6